MRSYSQKGIGRKNRYERRRNLQGDVPEGKGRLLFRKGFLVYEGHRAPGSSLRDDCDGPHGLRKQEGEGDHLGIHKSIETVCYPSAAAPASSFDRSVMERNAPWRLGELWKDEQAEAKGAH